MTAVATALCFLGYFLGYTIYARYLARRVFSLDPEVVTITLLSLRVAVSATIIAAVLGIPLAYHVATREFRGKGALLTLFNTLMALPTVVVGLFCYSFLSRKGPLGFMDLLFTPSGIILGDVILAFPLIVGLTIVFYICPWMDSRKRGTGGTP